MGVGFGVWGLTLKEEKVDEDLIIRSACNRAVNSFFNTLLGYMASKMYLSFDEANRNDMEKFLKQLEEDVVSDTLELVGVSQQSSYDFRKALVNCVEEISSPLNKFISNVKGEGK